MHRKTLTVSRSVPSSIISLISNSCPIFSSSSARRSSRFLALISISLLASSLFLSFCCSTAGTEKLPNPTPTSSLSIQLKASTLTRDCRSNGSYSEGKLDFLHIVLVKLCIGPFLQFLAIINCDSAHVVKQFFSSTYRDCGGMYWVL